MSDLQVHLPDCPNCGAPLPLRRVYRGAVDCEYCGRTVALRALAPLAADPAAVEAIERRAPPPALSVSLGRSVARHLDLPAGFVAAWALVATGFAFPRNPSSLPLLWPAVAALAALLALAWKRRLAAIGYALLVGGASVLKPFVRPILDAGGTTYAPTSATALTTYVVPGAVLLGLAVLAVLSIRPDRLRTDLALLRPRLPVAIALLLGGALAGGYYGGETNRDLLDRYAGRFEAMRQVYAGIGRALAADPEPALPDRLEGLDPLPVFRPGDPSANTDLTTLQMLGYPGRRVSPDFYPSGDLSSLFRRVGDHWDWDDWERTDELDGMIARGLAARYLATGGCAERDDSDDYFTDCVAWLVDLRTGEPLLRVPVLTVTDSTYALADDILEALEAATGGTFRSDPL